MLVKMRLLKHKSDYDFELVTFNTDDLPSYAILSHTCTDGEEVTYDELVAGTGKGKAGYAKILFCGEKAAEDNLQYFWVDTCCINKRSESELSEAINSMFRWYQRATKCYVYLLDVQVPEEVIDIQAHRTIWEHAFRQSRWFTRGWTLQELLAPASVEFFSRQGRRLGSKISLELEIHEITQIPVRALQGQHLSQFSVDERISWTAKRRTTRKEDKAYCLLGIFGVFMPLIYGEGEEHASLRLKKEICRSSEAKEANDNDRTSGRPDQSIRLKPSSNIPFRRDDDFVDRGDLLTHIDQRCSRPAGRAALVGFGGFGKSQLAIEYAYRVRQRSPNTWVFWVHASNSARLEAAFGDIAEKVGLSSQPNAVVDTLRLVRSWLCNEDNGRWLMIVDNVDTDVVIETQKGKKKVSLASLLPQTDHGAILFTSRNADVARSLVGREKDIIAVGTMSDDEAVQLLGNNLGDTSMDGGIELVKALDCIPLAIVQAAAYINRLGPRMSITKYLGEFKMIEKQTQLLHRTALDLRRNEQASNSVFRTWQISFDYIRQKRPWAAYLLSFMSFFNRQGIPEFMVRHYIEKDSEQQDNLSGRCLEEEDIDFEEDMAVLRAFSLVSTTQRKDEFEMHGLVQLATRIWLRSTDTEKIWHRAFIQAMAQEFPTGDYANWRKCQTLFPHVLPVEEQGDCDHGKFSKWGLLLNNAGWYAWRQGLFPQAERMVLKALKIRKEVLNVDDSSTLLSSNLLGCILSDSGKYEEAESMHRQTLATSEKVLGKEHPYTLMAMNNLAEVLNSQGKYKEAESMHRQTLATREKVLGKEHLDTLTTMNNLALVLNRQGKHEEAGSMHRQTLVMREKVLGKEHPDTLITMNNLAEVLNRQGKYDDAESMHRQTLATREKVLGKEHPDTLMTMNNLALVLHRQGKHEEAGSMYRQTLATSEKVLGKEHPNTLTTMNNLAGVLNSQGKYKEAESMHRQTLAMREKVLGKEHPNTLTTMNNLAGVLNRQGKHGDAGSMHRQTLVMREKVLGKENPSTLTSMNNLALVLHRQGKHEEAGSMYRQTLATSEKVLGKEHPDTLTTMNNLAGVLNSQGKYEEAESMHRQTLATREKVLGKEHPNTLTTMNNLAEVLNRQGKHEEAGSMHRQTLATREKVLGKEHPDTLTSMENLAEVLNRQSKHEEAGSTHRQTLVMREKGLGEEHPDTLTTMNNLAEVLNSQGRYEEAGSMHRQTLATREKVLGKEHPDTLTTMNNLAGVLNRQGKYEEAESMHRQTLATREKVLGKEHPDTLMSVSCLADILVHWNCYDKSAALYERACAGYSAILGNDHPTTRACREHYLKMLAFRERDVPTLPDEMPQK